MNTSHILCHFKSLDRVGVDLSEGAMALDSDTPASIEKMSVTRAVLGNTKKLLGVSTLRRVSGCREYGPVG